MLLISPILMSLRLSFLIFALRSSISYMISSRRLCCASLSCLACSRTLSTCSICRRWCYSLVFRSTSSSLRRRIRFSNIYTYCSVSFLRRKDSNITMPSDTSWLVAERRKPAWAVERERPVCYSWCFITLSLTEAEKSFILLPWLVIGFPRCELFRL